jgi:hypothetical protein
MVQLSGLKKDLAKMADIVIFLLDFYFERRITWDMKALTWNGFLPLLGAS